MGATNWAKVASAVVFSEKGEVLAWFGMSLGEDECAGLNVDDKEQIITELEVLVLLTSLGLWKDRL